MMMMSNEILTQNILVTKTSWKLTLPEHMREFPTFYRVYSFVTVFTVAVSFVHIFFQINAIHALLSHLFTPILIWPTHLPLVITRGLFPSGVPIKIQQAHLLCPIHATYPAHLILTKFGHLNNHIHWHAQNLFWQLSSSTAICSMAPATLLLQRVLWHTSRAVWQTFLDFINAVSQQ